MDKYFNGDKVIELVKSEFEKVIDGRIGQVKIKLGDALMSGYAVFALKEASLLAFDKRGQEPENNLREIYKIEEIPSDTQMRTILDEVAPEELRGIYKALWQEVEKSEALAEFRYLPEGYLISLDGSQYFKSHKVSCPQCLKKQLKNGEVLYYHQMLGGVIVSPEKKEVLPLLPEPIVRQDGSKKNDCERNAAKRFIEKVRQDQPELPLVMVEDGLSSNAPHIDLLKAHNIHFILGAKESDHTHLFGQIEQAVAQGETQELTSHGLKGKRGRYRWFRQLALNAAHPDLLVNVLQYWETDATGKTTHWTWVTDLSLNRNSVRRIMRAGRARWKVENETFNTLKNQGYHFDHNFGHGHQYLSALFATLMMLAFFVDQLQQLGWQLFQKVWHKLGSKRLLWERVRALFFELPFSSMRQLYRALLYGFRIERMVILDDTS